MTQLSQAKRAERTESPARAPTKKEQIIALFNTGITDVSDIALITRSRPSYVASVLQAAELLTGYFDLYTTTGQSMNVYSKFFAGKLGYKDTETARASREVIDRYYRQFRLAGDRAGQHHALMVAMTLFNRARWSNKLREADVFRHWLRDRLDELDGPLAAGR